MSACRSALETRGHKAAGTRERARLRRASDLGLNHAVVEFEAFDHGQLVDRPSCRGQSILFLAALAFELALSSL
jgi:hypothetical protein